MADATGGIDLGESPRDAALRELVEEIGTNNVEVVAEARSWLHYDWPDDIAWVTRNGRWKGQRQKWFVMRHRGSDSDINIATEHPEFDSWRWLPPRELPLLAISFKRRVYFSLLREFNSVLDP